MPGADVTITYDFLPTEQSIRDSAKQATKQFKQIFGKENVLASTEGLKKSMESSTKKITTEFDAMTSSIINLLRATQIRTSLQTKILSAMKFFEPFKDKITSGMERLKLIPERPPAISPTGIGQGEGGENIGQATAAATGGMGGMMGALGAILGILVVISVAMTLISAFFDAVGPIIKVVMKMFSAMILILLMPFLKRGLPILFGILQWMIKAAKGVSELTDAFMDMVGAQIGKILSGDTGALFDLLFAILVGPLGMLFIVITKELIKFLAGVDWNAVIASIIPILQGAFEFIGNLINELGKTVFGEELWGQIMGAVLFIQRIFSPGGVWKVIKNTIDWLGKNIFGQELWDGMKSVIGDIIAKFSNFGAVVETVIRGIATFYDNTVGKMTGRYSGYDYTADIIKKLPQKNPFSYDSPNSEAGGDGGGDNYGGIPEGYRRIPGGGLETVEERDTRMRAEMGDFISRPGLGVQPFSANDTIIGTKNPDAIGGQNITNNLYVTAGIDKAEYRKILSEFSRSQGKNLRNRTSYFGGAFA